ncbi:MAG TPA: methionine synthase [Tepidisphaeraceae bacterium]|jgi:5-methyltetrahydrofolate--homocysteine methyltransferase|nr:methionine synthase [Tepidisphaeraceae bacterium]
MSRQPFLDLVRKRVVVLDGAMGTTLHTYPLDLHRDWQNQENISEILNLTRPDLIQEIHENFLAVGCDAVESNTFGGSKIVLTEAGLADRTVEVNRIGAQIARKACDRFETPDRPRYVVGSVGPGTKIITLGQTTWDVMEESFFQQISGLLEGGVDVLLIETQQDLLAIKCAIAAANRAFAESGRRVPIMVQASMDQQNGREMLTGSDPTALVAAIAPFNEVDVLGLNCAFGPYELSETIRFICENWPRWVSVQPNAGLPVFVEGKAHFPMNPGDYVKGVMRFVEEFGVNIVGGCCGTTTEHLKLLCEAVGFRPSKKRQPTVKPQISSLISAVDIRQDNSYLIVAERTNTNGSRQFKRLLQEDGWDGLVGMARDELRDGSHVLDVCVDFVGRDGVADMRRLVSRYVNALPGPLMLDSTNPAVMEAGLKLAGGRCVLNSMNLEDGEERVAHICALAKKYGAAVVAGTIDEDKQNAMARTADRKLSIARRIRDLAVENYGLKDQDIFFDPLVLPISTGIEEDRRNALETIEGTRRISAQLPDCHTVVGLSNVSFGLKPAARVVLNSAFLHELMEAGLTAAIVHASKILPRNKIDDEKWNAAMDLIYDRRREGFDPLTHFISLFPESSDVPKEAVQDNLPVEEKLKRHIIDGEKRQLADHLNEAMQKYPPLDIINNILLEGMKVVGDLFGSGQMQLPFVLQSAETMKAAVAHLEPFMEKADSQSKGRIVLATVKGDVHDIGKNLVDIILTNNGYTVFNLGIKQPVNDILRAAREKSAHAIGMSGLLVKSVAVMKENLEELNAQGVNLPVLLGGAALTRDYAEETLAELYRGPLLYCKDAFEGLHMMDRISGGTIASAIEHQRQRAERRRTLRSESEKKFGHIISAEKPGVPIAQDNPVPAPPFWGRRIVTGISPRHAFTFINKIALFTGQWGFKQKGTSPEEYRRVIADKAEPAFESLKRQALDQKLLDPKVAYGYFPVQSEAEDLIVYHVEEFPTGSRTPKAAPRQWLRFSFPRQSSRRRMCIADFFRSKSSGEFDVLGVQLVTVGDRATEASEKLRLANRYQDYLYLHGFGVESAEGLAEYWHKYMRQELGFGSEDAAGIEELFHQGYRGSRYSFGYPACPNLEDRAKIVELLHPDEIGVQLSENFMLIPEQSTDALVVHHPQAKYFDA